MEEEIEQRHKQCRRVDGQGRAACDGVYEVVVYAEPEREQSGGNA